MKKTNDSLIRITNEGAAWGNSIDLVVFERDKSPVVTILLTFVAST